MDDILYLLLKLKTLQAMRTEGNVLHALAAGSGKREGGAGEGMRYEVCLCASLCMYWTLLAPVFLKIGQG